MERLRAASLDRFPAIDDLRILARRKIPPFAWEHLDAGVGEETTAALNRAAFNAVRITPQFLNTNTVAPSIRTRVFDQEFEAPFGMAPVGVTGLLWPGGEHMLARAAARNGIPYCLSVVACETPESVGPLVQNYGWFQLYPPEDRTIRDDVIRRARESGFRALIVTVDVPVYGMRERQRRVGLTESPRMGLRNVLQMTTRMAWVRATLRHGAPRFRTLERYANNKDRRRAAQFVLHQLCAQMDERYLGEIREQWRGPLLLKGILHPADARKAVKLGFDGIVVSNHGGRQFDGAPASIQALPGVFDAVGGSITIILDSGVRTGLDVVRALVLGANFVLIGRGFLYGIGALGEAGGHHVAQILKEDVANNMKQLGVEAVEALRHLRSDVCVETE